MPTGGKHKNYEEIERKEKEELEYRKARMTVFYNKDTYKIDAVCEGVQSIKFYSDLDIEVAKEKYDFIIIMKNYDVLYHFEWFEIINENGKIKLKVREEYKDKTDESLIIEG